MAQVQLILLQTLASVLCFVSHQFIIYLHYYCGQAHEKMYQALKRINNDAMGISDGGSDPVPKKFQKQSSFKSSSEVIHVPFS